jgi:CheY-like chemotaxis protein
VCSFDQSRECSRPKSRKAPPRWTKVIAPRFVPPFDRDQRAIASSHHAPHSLGRTWKIAMSEIPLIVCIDDDPSASEAVQALLTASGLSAETFPSAEEFLRLGRPEDTSCLIADVRLGGMSGLELQSCLLESGHDIPIIFVTASPHERIRERALRAGAVCFLSKPITRESLLTCIHAALRRRTGSQAGATGGPL